MGKVEHVIFSIHDVMIILYISRSKCILAGCVILICIRWYCILLISSVSYLYNISWYFFYNLYVFHLSYVIHAYIYLSLDHAELRKENTTPVLQQMSKGKIVLWHIFCLKHHRIVHVLEWQVSIHIHSEKLFL